MSNIESLKDTIVPKSDQLNADDLITGPITVTVKAVTRGTPDQPISLAIDGGYQPYKPCKSMRRVLIALWGDNGKAWVGRSMTLYCDSSVRFGGVQVGGIRISHVSDISNEVVLMLTTTRSKRAEFKVKPLIQKLEQNASPEIDLVKFFKQSIDTCHDLDVLAVCGNDIKERSDNGDFARHPEWLHEIKRYYDAKLKALKAEA